MLDTRFSILDAGGQRTDDGSVTLDAGFSILVIPAKTVTKSWSSLVNAEGIRDTKYEIQPALSAVEWERQIIFETSWGDGYN